MKDKALAVLAAALLLMVGLVVPASAASPDIDIGQDAADLPSLADDSRSHAILPL